MKSNQAEMVNQIEFASNKWPVLSVDAGKSPSSWSCWAHHSCERLSPLVDIEHRQHGKSSISILRQATIANLGKAPEPLECKEGMLDLGSDTGLTPVRGFVSLGQGSILIGPFVGEVVRLRRKGLESLPLRPASVGAVAIQAGFLAMQQIRYFVAVVRIRGGDAGAMDQPALAIRPDMQLHAEVPLVAFLGLVHLRMAALVFVLGRGRCRNQGRINYRATRELHSIRHEQLADLGKQGSAQMMRFEQVTEIEQGRGIGHSFRPRSIRQNSRNTGTS